MTEVPIDGMELGFLVGTYVGDDGTKLGVTVGTKVGAVRGKGHKGKTCKY